MRVEETFSIVKISAQIHKECTPLWGKKATSAVQYNKLSSSSKAQGMKPSTTRAKHRHKAARLSQSRLELELYIYRQDRGEPRTPTQSTPTTMCKGGSDVVQALETMEQICRPLSFAWG